MPRKEIKKIKKLSARLLKLGISNYLITTDFNHFCREHDIDRIWAAAIENIIPRSQVAVPIPEYTAKAEEAFGLFLYFIYAKEEANFKEIVRSLLINFAKWSPYLLNFSEIKDDLLEFGISENEFEALIKIPSVGNNPNNSTGKGTNPPISEDNSLEFGISENEFEDIIKIPSAESSLKCRIKAR